MKYFFKKAFTTLIIISVLLNICIANNRWTIDNDNFKKAEEFYKKGNIDDALSYYLKAEQEFKNSKNWEAQVSVLLKKSEIELSKSNYNESQKLLNSAKQLNKDKCSENKFLLADIFKLQGSIYLYKNKFSESVNILEKSLSIINTLDIDEYENLASIYNDLASAYYFLGKYDKTIYYFRQALIINKKSNNLGGLVTNLNNLGALYQAIGQYKESIDYIEQAINIDLLQKKNRDIPIYLSNIGNSFLKLGQYDKALEYFNRALEIDLQRNVPEQVATDYNNIAWIEKEYNNYNKAIEKFKIAADIFQKSNNHISYAKCLDNLGDLYRETGLFKKAEKTLKQANKIFLDAGQKKAEAVNWNNQGLLYTRTANIKKAIICHEKAIKINKELNIPQGIASNYNNLGMIYFEESDYKRALEYFQKAMTSLIHNFDEEDVFIVPDYTKLPLEKELLKAIKNKAQVFYRLWLISQENLKTLNASLDNYCLAVRLIDRMHLSYYSQDKLKLSNDESESYEKAVSIAYKLYKISNDYKYIERAYKVTEMSKAAYLYELIRENEAKLYSNIPDSMLLVEKVLKADIFDLEKQLSIEEADSIPNDSIVTALKEELFDKKFQQLEKLKKYLDENYPKYYQLKYDNSILDIKSVQNHLSKSDALIEYNIVDNRLYQFVILRDSVFFTQEGIDSSFFESILNIQHFQSEMYQSPEIFRKFSESSYVVYNKVLSNIREHIKAKNLIIIPDGLLGYIPFETLLTHKINPDKTYYKDSPYLIKEHAVSYAYSATLLFNSYKKHERKPDKELLAIAPSFNMNDYLPAFLTERGEEFVDLIGSKLEVNSINKIFKGEKYLDSVATEANFKHFASDYKILHIATHGIIDDEDPMNSRLLFYRNDDSLQDGDLYTYELFNMRLNADLAVLSACNTGCGKLEKGEGIISLARGFLYAGVPSIVMTLWCVPDGTSVMIVEKFYKYLKDGFPKNIALQKAKLDYLEQADNLKANPYFWAGFVNIGNTDALNADEKDNPDYWWIGAFVILIVFFVWRIKIKKS